ncbi:MAG TPA: hypothetical protein PLY96_00350, partial [Chromatiaceae bacterium]|nr:hypothetical protein [Chromatiaceae bacterium]
ARQRRGLLAAAAEAGYRVFLCAPSPDAPALERREMEPGLWEVDLPVAVGSTELTPLKDREIVGGLRFQNRLREVVQLPPEQEDKVIAAAEIHSLLIDAAKFQKLDRAYLSGEQVRALEQLQGRAFAHRWELYDALASLTPAWRKLENNKINKPFNKQLGQQLDYIFSYFEVPQVASESL